MSHRKNILFPIAVLMAMLLSAVPVSAQTGKEEKMKVESFSLDELDPTAITAGTSQIDPSNGNRCALIKIETTQRGFTFDGGGLFVNPVPQNADHPAEIWLYVSDGVNRLTISHPQLGQITKYDLGQRVRSGKTYRLKLTTDEINTQRVDYSTTSDVEITVFPTDAELYINGMRQSVGADGTLRLPLAAGTHNYRVSAPLHHTVQDQFEVKGDGSDRLDLRLRQAYGYLTVLTQKEFEGADVLVDGERVGVTPLENAKVSSGRHKVTVRKYLYKPHEEEISVRDSLFVNLTPRLEDNYGSVRLAVASDKDAAISIDGREVGNGKWDGRLEAGTHTITVSKKAHRPTERLVTVTIGKQQNVILDDPEPIYGSLTVKTEPAGAEVTLNGVKAGTTPYYNDKLLIGDYKMELTRKGCRDESRSFSIGDGESRTFNERLVDFCSATVTASPYSAMVSVNGGDWYFTPYKLNLLPGEYKLTFEKSGYLTKTIRKKLDGSTADFTVRLLRLYVRPYEFYLQAGYDYSGFSSINFGLGGYIANVNIEANYLLGVGRSGSVFWNDDSGVAAPFSATYSAMGGNVKAGYGLRLGNRIRVTPQLGCQFFRLSEKTQELLTGDFTSGIKEYGAGVSAPKGASLTGGLRLSIALVDHLSLSVTPQYMIGVGRSEGLKALSDVRPEFKSYTDGFSLNANINVFF